MNSANTLEERMQEKLQLISQLRLLDDNLMTLVFNKNIEATQLLLNIILKRTDVKVLEVVGQQEYKNSMPDGRSIRIDIYAKDGDEKVYDIEIQRQDSGAAAKRARFHSSMIDTHMLKKGQSFSEIHESFVIFITENDIFEAGLSLYHIDRVVKEIGEDFGDGSHIIYVNGSYVNESDPVGKLMHDFRCTNPKDMYYPVLAKHVGYFKESQGGQENMCKLVDDYAKKVGAEMAQEIAQEMAQEMEQEMAQEMATEMATRIATEMVEKCVLQEKKDLAINMLKDPEFSKEKIAVILKLPLLEIEKLESKLKESECYL